MQKHFAAFATTFQNNLAAECAISALLVVGFALIGFLSHAMINDLQASVLVLT